MRRTAFALLILILAGRTFGADPQPYKATPGPSAVASLEADWTDAARSVTVPIKVYFPKELAAAQSPAPLIIFSHGLGGSREGYSIWAEHWASYGYVVLLPTHVGSDTAVLSQGVQALYAAANTQNALRRTQDVSFVIDQMTKANAGTLADKSFAIFNDKIDLKHIGMSGHSFGSVTTLMISGEALPLQRSLADPRITAAIAMSPQPAAIPNQKAAFGAIKIPIFHITGTNDDAPAGLGSVKAADRRIPFDNSTFAETFLVTFAGANHMSFSGASLTIGGRLRQAQSQAPAPAAAQEAAIHMLVKEGTTAFWDAYLKSDAKAKHWLETDFAKVAGAGGKFESKVPKP